MSDACLLKSCCQSCGGHLEFPSAGLGMAVDCPHCGAKTLLGAQEIAPHSRTNSPPAGAKPSKPNSRKPLLIVLASSVFLVGLAVAAVAMLHGTKVETPAGESNPRLGAHSKPAAAASNSGVTAPPTQTPDVTNEFAIGGITLQKTPGSDLIYAVGMVTNCADRQRFGVRIELELLDAQDQTIGTASDYVAIVEAQNQWQFRALLAKPNVATARFARIEEQQ